MAYGVGRNNSKNSIKTRPDVIPFGRVPTKNTNPEISLITVYFESLIFTLFIEYVKKPMQKSGYVATNCQSRYQGDMSHKLAI